MKKSNLLDITLHHLSIELGRVFRSSYYDLGADSPVTSDLLTAYRNVRRHISMSKNGKRYGHNEADAIMQGGMM